MLKLLAFAFAVATFVAGGVSGETHHVAGGENGWGPDFNVTAWLLGRRFTVGDKLRFECSGEDEGGIVEVRDAHELLTCDLSNPIRMLRDPVSHVVLEEEGVRYFISGNPDACRGGLKLPVTVDDQYKHDHPPPSHEPDEPSPPHQPPYEPSPPYEPDEPSPPHKAPPPPQPFPSAAARLDAVWFVLSAAVIVAYALTI